MMTDPDDLARRIEQGRRAHDDQVWDTDTSGSRSNPEAWAETPMGHLFDAAAIGTLVRPRPTLGLLDNGEALLYPGKVHGIAGPSGFGKTFLGLSIAVERMDAGEHVLYVDLEDTPETVALRLVADLGADPNVCARYFHYVSPQDTSASGRDAMCALASEFKITVAIIDSVGESMSADGLKENASEDVAAWFAALAKPLSHLGVAVLVLDHTVKSEDGGLWPAGSQRKRAAITGVQYIVDHKASKPFSRSLDGHVRLKCAKDRAGNYAHDETVAEVDFAQVDGRLRITMKRHATRAETGPDGGFRPTYLMEKVSTFVEFAPGCSQRGIEDAISGKAAAVRRAIDVLLAEGYLERGAGLKRSYAFTSVRPYREADDATA